jgi:hypothetical protein
MSVNNLNTFLTTEEVAKIIAKRTGKPISIRQVQKLIHENKIKHVERSGRYFVSLYDLYDFKRMPPGQRPKQKE